MSDNDCLIKLICNSPLKELLALKDHQLREFTPEELDCAVRTAKKLGNRRLEKRVFDLKRHKKL